MPSPSAQQDTPPAPPLPRVDARAASFGFGVPLRATVGEAATDRATSIIGAVAVRQQTVGGLPPTTNNPTVPPWVALPLSDPARTASDRLQKQRTPALPCGCAGRCRGGH
jgi:hypothetical protein